MIDAFYDWLFRLVDRAAVALVLWLCGKPDAPWSADS